MDFRFLQVAIDIALLVCIISQQRAIDSLYKTNLTLWLRIKGAEET